MVDMNFTELYLLRPIAVPDGEKSIREWSGSVEKYFWKCEVRCIYFFWQKKIQLLEKIPGDWLIVLTDYLYCVHPAQSTEALWSDARYSSTILPVRWKVGQKTNWRCFAIGHYGMSFVSFGVGGVWTSLLRIWRAFVNGGAWWKLILLRFLATALHPFDLSMAPLGPWTPQAPQENLPSRGKVSMALPWEG